MSIPAILLGSILLALGVFMVIKARKQTTSLKKYEFENRSADGVVEFSSIDSSRAHSADKGLYIFIGIIGFFVGIFGVALLLAGFSLGY
jgi:hypothetical protein